MLTLPPTVRIEAIAAAALSPGPDNISFDPGLAGATLSVGEDPNLPGTAFFVTSEIQISGENSPGLVIRPEAGKNIRLFQVAYATPLGLREITLAGGRAIDGPGGAILASFGKVYLDAVTLTDNSSSGSGAGGGAVAVSGGRLAIRNSTFFNNRVESATGQGAGAGEGGGFGFVGGGEAGLFFGEAFAMGVGVFDGVELLGDVGEESQDFQPVLRSCTLGGSRIHQNALLDRSRDFIEGARKEPFEYSYR